MPCRPPKAVVCPVANPYSPHNRAEKHHKLEHQSSSLTPDPQETPGRATILGKYLGQPRLESVSLSKNIHKARNGLSLRTRNEAIAYPERRRARERERADSRTEMVLF